MSLATFMIKSGSANSPMRVFFFWRELLLIMYNYSGDIIYPVPITLNIKRYKL